VRAKARFCWHIFHPQWNRQLRFGIGWERMLCRILESQRAPQVPTTSPHIGPFIAHLVYVTSNIHIAQALKAINKMCTIKPHLYILCSLHCFWGNHKNTKNST
jgi:hypothetical protein